jgi:hypothetical protein
MSPRRLLPTGAAPYADARGGRAGKVRVVRRARVRAALVRPGRFVLAAGGVDDLPEIARCAECTLLDAGPHGIHAGPGIRRGSYSAQMRGRPHAA